MFNARKSKPMVTLLIALSNVLIKNFNGTYTIKSIPITLYIKEYIYIYIHTI